MVPGLRNDHVEMNPDARISPMRILPTHLALVLKHILAEFEFLLGAPVPIVGCLISIVGCIIEGLRPSSCPGSTAPRSLLAFPMPLLFSECTPSQATNGNGQKDAKAPTSTVTTARLQILLSCTSALKGPDSAFSQALDGRRGPRLL